MLLARNWWLFLVRGILALIFGIVALVFPAAAFLSLVLVFGAFALVDGIFAIISAFTSNAKSENWWWLILEGVVGILIGVLTVIQPAAMGAAWVYLIAAWAIVSGSIELMAAYQFRDVIRREWLLALDGAIAILFGLVLIVFPSAGALAVVWLIGAFAIVSGVILLVIAFRLRGRARGTGQSAAYPSTL